MPVAVSKKTGRPPGRKAAEAREQEENLGNHNAPEGYDENEDLLNMEIPPPPIDTLENGAVAGERLMISHLAVENFKSYYGAQTIGPFHKNFTAIIGPNGSGKSNVIDALLFVFGYRASKIRSKKLSVLIHSSAGRDNIASCTVAVHFQRIIELDRDDYSIVPDSQFFVSRSAFRDNSSRYMVNGRSAQFKDVAKLLGENGIDLIHNRFLILQGEVEQISLMKPKAENDNEEGMLEYLEDIIGSNRLKLPIKKLLFKLDGIQEKRAAQLLRLKYAEKERLALVEPVKEVVENVRLEMALSCVSNKICCCNKLKLTTKIKDLLAERDQLVEELSSAESELLEYTEKNVQLKNERKELQKILDKCQQKLSKEQGEISTEKQKMTKTANDVERMAKEKVQIEDKIAKQETLIKKFQDLPEKAEAKIEQCKLQLEEAEAAIKANTAMIEERLGEVEEKTAALKRKREQLESELSKHSVVEDDTSSKLSLAQGELNDLQSDSEAQHRVLAELKGNLADLKSNLNSKLSDFAAAQKCLPKVTEEYEILKAECTSLREKESNLVDRIRQLQVEVEESRQTTENFKTTNRLLRSLMEQKKNGRLPGIFGRLGDLGAVDEKYDVAVSTTCSPLDNIVVDTVETAQKCIEFLKKEQLGTASFIALEKQRHYLSQMRNRPNTPENALRLFDLIRVVDENVLPAFYYALQDTLVADDITAAARIAFPAGGKRWRTVTLKGEVVETTGAMTGGGNAQRSGRIGREILVDTSKKADDDVRKIAKLIQELDGCHTTLTDIRQRLQKLDDSCSRKQAEFTRTKEVFSGSKVDVENLKASIIVLEGKVNNQESRKAKAVVDPVVLNKAIEKVNSLKNESAKITKVTDALRMEFIGLTDRINNYENEIMGKEKDMLRQAAEMKKSAEQTIAKEKSALASNQRNLSKAQRCKADLEVDLEKSARSMESHEGNKQENDARIAELNEILKARKEEIRLAEEAFKEAVERGKKFNEEELELQRKVKQLSESQKSMEAKLMDMQKKKRDIRKQISKLFFYNLDNIENLPDEVMGNANKHVDAILREFRSDGQQSLENANETMGNDVTEDTFEASAMDVDVNEPSADEQRGSQREIVLEQLPKYKAAQTIQFDEDLLRTQLKKLEKLMSARKTKTINMEILTDYNERVKRYNLESEIFGKISRQRDLHRELHDSLRKQRLREFMEGYRKIGLSLKEMYQMITLGGDASLDLVDSLDPFSEGISFGVRPPKKSWKQITNLSGGEKTLASLAFVFALHLYRPTPLYVMDEIDAALDFRNVSIISSCILERTKNAQFVVISLRNNMFERGDRIVGIYKVHDCTYNAVLNPRAAEEDRKKNAEALKLYTKKRLESSQEVENILLFT